MWIQSHIFLTVGCALGRSWKEKWTLRNKKSNLGKRKIHTFREMRTIPCKTRWCIAHFLSFCFVSQNVEVIGCQSSNFIQQSGSNVSSNPRPVTACPRRKSYNLLCRVVNINEVYLYELYYINSLWRPLQLICFSKHGNLSRTDHVATNFCTENSSAHFLLSCGLVPSDVYTD